MKQRENRKLQTNKLHVLLTALVFLMLGTVGGTAAYLVRQGGSMVSVMEPAVVSCVIEENQDGFIVIRNTGNTDVFVRVVVLVNWKDASGHVYAGVPEADVDYSLDFASDDWFTDENGFVYYAEAIAPDEEVLLCGEAVILTDAPEGCDLVTEFYAEAIQAEPADAVSESWHVRAEDGKISG